MAGKYEHKYRGQGRFVLYGKHKSKGTVTKMEGPKFGDRPYVCVYESWGNDHAPMTTCGHNFCFQRWNDGWKDLKADAELDPKYYEYLDGLLGADVQKQ